MSGLGVIEGLGTSLRVAADAVVVAGGVGVQVIESLKSDSIFRSVVANSGGVTGQVALGDVVSSLSTEEEAITTNDSISSEGGPLITTQPNFLGTEHEVTYPEHVEGSAGVKTGLLEDSIEKGGLGSLLRRQGGVEVNLDTLGNLVLNFNGVTEDVGGGPGLGDGQTMLAVSPLGLNVARDGIGLPVTIAGDLEGDIRGSLGLNLKGGAVEGVILAKQVIGGLSEVLKGNNEL